MDDEVSLVAADLTGTTAVVTGGGRGLGAEIARSLALAGARVALVARTRNQLERVAATITELGGHALVFPADVTDHAAVEGVTAQIDRVDLLVNDAGRFQALGAMHEIDPEHWWREIEVNLRGPMLFAHAVLPGMLSRGAGRIVNVVSGAATSPLPGASAYSAGKTALLRLTETLEQELIGTGIHAFAVDPGVLRTPMNEELLRTRTDLLRRWAPWFLELFADGREEPIDAATGLVLAIAGGCADSLGGRFLAAGTDLDVALGRVDEIRKDDLLTLRVPRPARRHPQPIA